MLEKLDEPEGGSPHFIRDHHGTRITTVTIDTWRNAMAAMPVEPENTPGIGRDLTGYVLVPAAWVEHYERLLEEREDAEAVRISEDVKAGREEVFSHEEVWGDQA